MWHSYLDLDERSCCSASSLALFRRCRYSKTAQCRPDYSKTTARPQQCYNKLQPKLQTRPQAKLQEDCHHCNLASVKLVPTDKIHTNATLKMMAKTARKRVVAHHTPYISLQTIELPSRTTIEPSQAWQHAATASDQDFLGPSSTWTVISSKFTLFIRER